MAKWGGAAVKCEVCRDHATHANSETVGHKPDHRPRVVHKRPACQRKWKARKDEIMATWTELRPAQPPVATAEKEMHAMATQPLTIAPSNVPEPVKRPRLKLPAELDVVMAEWLGRNEWKRGAAVRLFAVIEATRPELLVDSEGHRITASAFGHRCLHIIGRMNDPVAAAAKATDAQAKSEADALGKALHDQRTALRLGTEVIAGVMLLQSNVELDTLRTLVDLMRR